MKLLYSAAEIRHATIGLAKQLNSDYKGHQIHFLGVLKGSFVFLADLVREVTVPCSVDFVRLSSYGAGAASSGTVRELMSWTDPLDGCHVVVVEEIVDSGTTLTQLVDAVRAEGVASLRVCALIDKTGRREKPVQVDYRGFSLEDGFVVGYGLDYAERYRNLADVYVLNEDEIAT